MKGRCTKSSQQLAAGKSGGVLLEYIIMKMEESGLKMDVGNARPASLERVDPIELNEHWNEEFALSFKQYLVCGRYPDVLPVVL